MAVATPSEALLEELTIPHVVTHHGIAEMVGLMKCLAAGWRRDNSVWDQVPSEAIRSPLQRRHDAPDEHCRFKGAIRVQAVCF